MTWTVTKNPAGFRLLCSGGRVIATFKRQTTDLECEVVRGALETIEKLQQREARLQAVEIELADKKAVIQDLEKATAAPTTKGNTHA